MAKNMANGERKECQTGFLHFFGQTIRINKKTHFRQQFHTRTIFFTTPKSLQNSSHKGFALFVNKYQPSQWSIT